MARGDVELRAFAGAPVPVALHIEFGFHGARLQPEGRGCLRHRLASRPLVPVTPVPTRDERHAPADLASAPDRFRALAAEHYENFPVGSWLVPKAQRRHMHRLYAFARTGDDLADEHADRAGLHALWHALAAHLEGGVDPADRVPMLADLAATVRECGLDRDLLFALLDAFEQDLSVRRYADEAELRAYCQKSADPVGRLVLQIFGASHPERLGWSDRICTGLQLVNHLQDMGEDYTQRDRIYFPQADLARHGVAPEDLAAPAASAGLRALALEWCGRLEQELGDGWPLVRAVRGRLRWELRAIVRGAAAVLRAVRAADGDVLACHVRLSKPRRLATLFGGLLLSAPPAALRR